MSRRHRFTALLVWVVCCLSVGVLPSGAASLPQVAAASSVRATPGALAVSVPLGQTRQETLTISGTDSSSDTPLRLFEAFSLDSSAERARAVPTQQRVAIPAQTTRVDPQINARLAATPTGKTDFLVFLGDQSDLSAAYQDQSWTDRGWMVYRLLHDHAEQSQAGLRALLDQRGTIYTPYWIVNALAVHGTQGDLQALAGRAEVAVIQATQRIALEPSDSQPAVETAALSQCNADSSDDTNPICWNIRKLGADRVWRDFGVTGQGITVGNIDTGVNYTHNALVQQYRGYVGSNSFDHRYNWFDPQGTLAAPADSNGHGTHTMGSMVARGNGSVDQPAVGVAPGAHWIAAQGCEQSTCNESDLIAAAQWMLAPTDLNRQNPRPDLRPHIINNSWSGNSNDLWYAGYTSAWRAAGIFPVFAAGNKSSGAVCGSIQSPGDYPDVLAVGATDTTDTIASFSTRGPTKNGRLKPDVSAPGVQIVSTYIGSDTKYSFLQGTSMAAPQAAGVVALLWSANPALIGNYDATYALLTGSAKRISDVRCGDAENAPNNLYGYGRIQAYDAVAQANVNVPWLTLSARAVTLPSAGTSDITVTFDASKVPGPGTYRARILVNSTDLSQDPLTVNVTLTVPDDANQATVKGTVRDSVTGAPLSGRVSVDNGASVAVDTNGKYSLTLPTRLEPYSIVASARGYLSETAAIVLDKALTVDQPFTLTADLQSLLVDTTPLSASLTIGEVTRLTAYISNIGTQPLSYTVSVPTVDYGVWPSESSQTATLNQPANAVPIVLSDDGTSKEAIPLGFDVRLYGTLYRSVYVNANGLISLGPEPSPTAFSGTCGPTNITSGAALLPFYADLDPAQGGEVSYASTSEGFVVTYNDVPLHQKTPVADAPTYTFQVVIQPNSHIIYRYGPLGPLPVALTVGLQRNSFEGQIISCGAATTIAPGKVLELRPQPSSDLWAGLIAQTEPIPAGGTAVFNLVLRWVRPSGSDQPLRADIVIESDDPRQPQVRIPFTLFLQAAPYERFFPVSVSR